MNIGKAYGYIEQKSGNKHLIFASTDKNKSIKKKMQNFGMELNI